MKYVIKEMNGEELTEESGHFDFFHDHYEGHPDTDTLHIFEEMHPMIEVPTHGSISIEIKPGYWMNFKTSEWLTISWSEAPTGWEGEAT